MKKIKNFYENILTYLDEKLIDNEEDLEEIYFLKLLLYHNNVKL